MIEKHNIMADVLKSKITMTFRLFTLSAMIPPIGNNIIIGMKEQAVIVPNNTDDPVF